MPKKAYQFATIADLQIHDPFLSPLQEKVRTIMLPYQEAVLKDQIPDVPKSHAIENFKIAAGLSQEEYYGMVFQDSDLAKWLEAVAYSLAAHPDEKLAASADEVIDIVEKAQQPDGYLDTYFINKAPEEKWKHTADCHELYCAGHMIEAGIAYYQATGKRKLLDVCIRLCDCIDREFSENGNQGYPGHPEVELALMKMYRLTGEERYKKLAGRFIDRRGQDPDYFRKEVTTRTFRPSEFYSKVPYEYMQNHAPVRQQTTVEGHAVRCMYLLTAAADLAAENEDESLWEASRAQWRNMLDKRMYVTGGIGSNGEMENFTIDYDLPNDSCYTETCASVAVCFVAKQMLEAEADSEYADTMELELFNGALSGMSLSGKQFFYVNPLEVQPGVSGKLFGYQDVLPERPGWYACACCPPNLARLLLSAGAYAWSYNSHAAYCHLFLGGTYQLGGMKLQVETDYPWNGNVRITVLETPEGTYTLGIRKPGWSTETSLKLNGKPLAVNMQTLNGKPEAVKLQKGYYLIEGRFAAGDTLEYFMDMPVRKIYANPAVRADSGCVAFRRGPIIYTFENVDNEAPLQTIRIPENGAMRALAYDPELLGGVVPIEIEAVKLECPNSLYAYEPPREAPAVLRGIPYYAWANRGADQMRVWMKMK